MHYKLSRMAYTLSVEPFSPHFNMQYFVRAVFCTFSILCTQSSSRSSLV